MQLQRFIRCAAALCWFVTMWLHMRGLRAFNTNTIASALHAPQLQAISTSSLWRGQSGLGVRQRCDVRQLVRLGAAGLVAGATIGAGSLAVESAPKQNATDFYKQRVEREKAYGPACAKLKTLVVRPNCALRAVLRVHPLCHACATPLPGLCHSSTPPRQCFLMKCACVSQPKGALKLGRIKVLDDMLKANGDVIQGCSNFDFNLQREKISFCVGSAQGYWVCSYPLSASCCSSCSPRPQAAAPPPALAALPRFSPS